MLLQNFVFITFDFRVFYTQITYIFRFDFVSFFVLDFAEIVNLRDTSGRQGQQRRHPRAEGEAIGGSN